MKSKSAEHKTKASFRTSIWWLPQTTPKFYWKSPKLFKLGKNTNQIDSIGNPKNEKTFTSKSTESTVDSPGAALPPHFRRSRGDFRPAELRSVSKAPHQAPCGQPVFPSFGSRKKEKKNTWRIPGHIQIIQESSKKPAWQSKLDLIGFFNLAGTTNVKHNMIYPQIITLNNILNVMQYLWCNIHFASDWIEPS